MNPLDALTEMSSDAVQAASSVAGVIVALASVAVAVAATMVARRATGSAEVSAAATAALSEIERRREHREMYPKVQISLERQQGAVQWQLVVFLEGPDALGHLDRFWVTIRDDGVDRSSLPPNPQATQEEIDAQIWGPYMLKPYGGGADGMGRSSTPRPLTVGERWRWYIQTTGAPPWDSRTDLSWWQQEYEGKPIRLTLHCERDGFDPWILRREVPQPDEQP